jgi:hypothetical protein
MTPALRELTWRPPAFLIRGLRTTGDGGRVFTKEDILELKRQRAGAEAAQDAPTLAAAPMAPKPEMAACEPPVTFASGVGARLGRELKCAGSTTPKPRACLRFRFASRPKRTN